MPNYATARCNKMNCDQSSKYCKQQDFKDIFNLRLDREDNYHNRRVIVNALKCDKNNPCRYPMTNPEATGCINKKALFYWRHFNYLLKELPHDDKIGHISVVDIDYIKKSHYKAALLQIYCPIFEKHKIIDLNEHSIFLKSLTLCQKL